MSDGLLPVSIEAEKWVIGSIMLDPDLMHAARTVLDPDDFSLEDHRRIWRAACTVYDGGGEVNRASVYFALQQAGDKGITLAQVIALDEGLPQIPNIDNYVRKVKDTATLRKVIFAARHIAQRAMSGRESAADVLDGFQQTAIDLIPRESGRGLQSTAELVDEVGIETLLAPRRAKGLQFPWGWMNSLTCGMLPAELWVLAARTSAGKTSAMLQHAVTAARRGHGVAVFSLEVGKPSLFSKACYQLAGVDSENGKRGRLTQEERSKLNQAAQILYDAPLYFDTQSSTVMAIHAAVRALKCKRKVDHVIVDYLQLLGNTGRHNTRAEAVGANAWALKMLATDFQIPVLLLSQFKRFEKDREPELGDLKESGDIENHANGIWFLHRQSEEDTPRIPVKFMLPKQRDGRRNAWMQYEFQANTQVFHELTHEDWSGQ